MFTFTIHPGAKNTATYRLPNWRLTARDAARLVYRPSWQNLFRRLSVPLLALVIIGAGWFAFARIPAADSSARYDEAIRRLGRSKSPLSTNPAYDGREDEQITLLKRQKAAREEAHATRVAERQHFARTYFWPGAAILVGLSLLPPVACLWNRTILRRGPRGDLQVSTWTLWPRTRSFDLHAFNAICYGAEECVHRDRRRRMVEHYWEWFVSLQGPGAAPRDGAAMLRFYPHRQKDRPGNQSRPPQSVRLMLEWVHTQTRYPVYGPTILEESSFHDGMFRRSRTLTQATPAFATGRPDAPAANVQRETHTFRSLEEMPPHLRAQVEAMQREGRTAQEVVARKTMRTSPAGGSAETPPVFTFRDEHENEHTFHSIAEMPPDIRAIFEEMGGAQ